VSFDSGGVGDREVGRQPAAVTTAVPILTHAEGGGLRTAADGAYGRGAFV
jgi:hypothetical protein